MEYSLSLDTFLQFKRKSPFEVTQSWLILKRENPVKHSHLDTKQIQGWWTVDSGQWTKQPMFTRRGFRKVRAQDRNSISRHGDGWTLFN